MLYRQLKNRENRINIRFSFSQCNTKEEIDYVVEKTSLFSLLMMFKSSGSLLLTLLIYLLCLMTCFVYPNSLSYQTYNVILFSFFPIKVEFESK